MSVGDSILKIIAGLQEKTGAIFEYFHKNLNLFA
jgi:hypothetical protein